MTREKKMIGRNFVKMTFSGLRIICRYNCIGICNAFIIYDYEIMIRINTTFELCRDSTELAMYNRVIMHYIFHLFRV